MKINEKFIINQKGGIVKVQKMFPLREMSELIRYKLRNLGVRGEGLVFEGVARCKEGDIFDETVGANVAVFKAKRTFAKHRKALLKEMLEEINATKAAIEKELACAETDIEELTKIIRES